MVEAPPGTFFRVSPAYTREAGDSLALSQTYVIVELRRKHFFGSSKIAGYKALINEEDVAMCMKTLVDDHLGGFETDYLRKKLVGDYPPKTLGTGS